MSVGETARSRGVQLSYRDVWGKTRRASDEVLHAVVQAMGETEDRAVEPVIVAWNGRTANIPRTSDQGIECTLVSEAGEDRSWRVAPSDAIELPRLPLGYYDLFCFDGKATHRSRVISAPRRLQPPEDRTWGAFLPLYALRTARSPAIADFTDLAALSRWTTSLGGSVVGTLPLFATFLDGPFDESPYAPVSRLFWNEIYVDVGSRGAPRSGDLIDFREIYGWKRGVLTGLAEEFFRTEQPRLHAYLDAHPHAEDYARFRAKSGASYEMHLFAQLLADEQLSEIDSLYLDLPIGVHPGGYDAQAFDVFASGVSAGAPPDGFFEGGQNWGFPPIDPVRSRGEGHSYFAQCIRTIASRARVIRIDHIMGLHRLFWIPDGFGATEGVYVRYPAHELYAVLLLEAHRAGCAVVGEDLGTVPAAVRTAMRRHGILRSHVFQFDPDVEPPPDSLASLNTHDTETFAQWLTSRRGSGGADGRSRDSTGTTARGKGRSIPSIEVSDAFRGLAAGDAPIVVVNLEDLWGEDRPQNVPGTTSDERPNWRRVAARTLEEFSADEGVTALLTEISSLRRNPT